MARWAASFSLETLLPKRSEVKRSGSAPALGEAPFQVKAYAGWLLRTPVDPYPFQFFNLALAILVGLQGPLIVMSQNRQSLKDRARADTDFKVNLKNEVNIETLLRELAEFRAEAKRRPSGSDGF